MEQLWAILWTYTETHILTYHNIGMVLATYVIIWASEPLVHKLVERAPAEKQVWWWDFQRNGKKIAGIVWCEIFVWIPTTQPDLCNASNEEDCQTVMGRIMLGIILGGGLSLLHKYLLARLKRAFGVETKVPIEVTNFNNKKP